MPLWAGADFGSGMMWRTGFPETSRRRLPGWPAKTEVVPDGKTVAKAVGTKRGRGWFMKCGDQAYMDFFNAPKMPAPHCPHLASALQTGNEATPGSFFRAILFFFSASPKTYVPPDLSPLAVSSSNPPNRLMIQFHSGSVLFALAGWRLANLKTSRCAVLRFTDGYFPEVASLI